MRNTLRRTLADRAAPVRRVLGHEWTIAALAALLLSLLINRGALADPAHTLPQDIWDPSLVSYLIAWDGYALLHQLGNIWHLNAFYPASYGLAYTDSLLGYAPFAIVGTGPEAAVFRYNVLYILAEALVLFGGYALARQLGLGRAGSALVGIALAVAPWRLAQAGHLQILSTGGMFLALAMLPVDTGCRWHGGIPTTNAGASAGLDRRRVAGRHVAALHRLRQSGFRSSMCCSPALVGGVLVWAYRRRPLPSWRLLAADGVGGLLFGAAAVLLAQPYLKVLELYPYTRRDASWVALYSPPPRGLFTAPAESFVWGEAHATARAELSIPGEMTLLPGFFAVRPRRRRAGLLGLAAAGPPRAGRRRDRLHDLQPGHRGTGRRPRRLPACCSTCRASRACVRPGRLMLWATLLLGLLAAGAVCALGALFRESAKHLGMPRPQPLIRVAVIVPVVLVFLEGLGTTPHVPVPPAPPALSTVAAPYLVLPTHEVLDMHVMLWSTDRFADMVNGGSGVVPTEQDQVRRAVVNFPDAQSVAYLRGIGVRTVVVLPSRASGTPLQNAATVPIDGLGITRDVRPDAVVFVLDPLKR